MIPNHLSLSGRLRSDPQNDTPERKVSWCVSPNNALKASRCRLLPRTGTRSVNPYLHPCRHNTRTKSRRSGYSQISLNRKDRFVGGTLLTSPGRLSDLNPVSGLIAGATVTIAFVIERGYREGITDSEVLCACMVQKDADLDDHSQLPSIMFLSLVQRIAYPIMAKENAYADTP